MKTTPEKKSGFRFSFLITAIIAGCLGYFLYPTPRVQSCLATFIASKKSVPKAIKEPKPELVAVLSPEATLSSKPGPEPAPVPIPEPVVIAQTEGEVALDSDSESKADATEVASVDDEGRSDPDPIAVDVFVPVKREKKENTLVGKMPTQASPVARKWVEKYAKEKMNFQTWNKNYGKIWGSWFATDNDELADQWLTTLGPLGVRGIGLDKSWDMPAFKRLVPEFFLDEEGNTLVSSYLVKSVIEGGPATGKLNPGDFIIGMDGKLFLPAIHPDLKFGDKGFYHFQDSRGVDFHAGLLIDAAAVKGKVSLLVVPGDVSFSGKKPQAQNTVIVDEKSLKSELPVHCDVRGGEQLELVVTDGGNGRGSDGVAWEPFLLKNKKTGKKIVAEPYVYSVGHGGSEFNTKDKVWNAHAPSKIVLLIPDGEWAFASTVKPNPSASVGLEVKKSKALSLSKEVIKSIRKVEVEIPRLGRFAKGLPLSDQKKYDVVFMLAEWLAAQQNPDGTWDRLGGWTSPIFDTALAGLALMSTGEDKYDAKIKKAAEFVAFSGFLDKWSVPTASGTIFLSEYYLKYKDARVLPAIRNQVQRMKSDMLYGDFLTGHGIHPGYRGSGVSIGGSTMTLALAVASKTPARVEDDVLDRMLDKAQEICPTGLGPYGRTAASHEFVPDMKAGGVYSGRHGPYYIASWIAGGPKVYTDISTQMYAGGPVGGADQGHSTETLSLLWAMPATRLASKDQYNKMLESYRWKLSLMLGFDGGIVFNPNRLEYMGAESVINLYIRTSAWIMGLCADREQLAITGKKEYLTKTFRNVPPVTDYDSRTLSNWKRNLGMVAQVLGSRAPSSFTQLRKEVDAIKPSLSCRLPLFKILDSKAKTVAKDILAGVKSLGSNASAVMLINYCAELVLGTDVRIRVWVDEESKKPNCEVQVQRPLSGKDPHLKGAVAEEMKTLAKWKFDGSVSFSKNGMFSDLTDVTWTDGSKFDSNSNGIIHKNLQNPTLSGNFDQAEKMSAHIKYEVDGIQFDYVRPMLVGNGVEPGNGEKEREITNDRQIPVKGKLIRDHGNWGFSFVLQNGAYVGAATQGNRVFAEQQEKGEAKPYEWISPEEAALTAGTEGTFYTTTDWYGLECRVAKVVVSKPGRTALADYSLKIGGKAVSGLKELQDFNFKTSVPLVDEAGKHEVKIDFKGNTKVSAIDLRLDENINCKYIVEAKSSQGTWVPLYWATTNAEAYGVRSFTPVSTKSIRVIIERRGGNAPLKLAELRLF